MRIAAQPITLCVLYLFACLTSTVLANESRFNEVLSVGDAAPDFSGLPGIDGKEHGLGEYDQAKAVVVVFTSNQCPVAVAYEDRLKALQKEWGERGVQIVAICPNFEAGHDLETLKEHAAKKAFNFPLMRDDNQQQNARAYGATHTPHVFLLDADRKIAYMGAIDDNEDPQKASKHYLQDAIDATLTGKTPEPAETQPFGCRVRYKRQRAASTRR